MNKNILLSEMGSRKSAWDILVRMYKSSSAYKKLIQDKFGIDSEAQLSQLNWDNIPILTKDNFYSRHRWADLISSESFNEIFSIVRSSGISQTSNKAKGFLWPQIKSKELKLTAATKDEIIDTLCLRGNKTLVIIGLSLGSWAGGDEFSFFFKNLSLFSDLSLTVFTPGNQNEVIEIINEEHSYYTKILVILCPSEIYYLESLANREKKIFPLEKITFMVTGEPFSETMRLGLQEKCGSNRIAMYSLYGSADTGFIGLESEYLVRLRQYLTLNPDISRQLGFSSLSIPNFFHVQTNNNYLEIVNNELIITQWQGLPLVRYNLKDNVQFYSWKETCKAIAEYDPANTNQWLHYADLAIPNFISLKGRSSGCIMLCGANIFETMLQETLRKSSLGKITTNAFVVWIEVQNGHQVLCWQIETNENTNFDKNTIDELYSEMVGILGDLQPEFAQDYEKLYKALAGNNDCLFKFFFCKYPYLTQALAKINPIKRRIIIESGPL